jgi:putative ABC transport system permease protein
MTTFLADLKYGFRMLYRSAVFSIVAILTLSLGIGVTTAVFSVVNTVLLRPLPFASQDQLAVVWESTKKNQFGQIETSYADYRDWIAQNKVFSELAAMNSTNVGMNMTGSGEPQQVQAAPVSANFFGTLQAGPALGRIFNSGDDRLGAQPVAILSYSMWKDQFGLDPKILDRQLRFDDQSYTVVGVMPPAFRYPAAAQLWVPLVPFLGNEGTELRIYRVLKCIGRLNPGVGMKQADAEMRVIADGLEARYPKFNDGLSASVGPLVNEIVGDSRPTLLILLSGAVFLLLIAVANVASLLLARMLERRHELGVRAALGADRARVMRQLLTEGILLGSLGAAGGVLLAFLGTRLLHLVAPANIPRIDEVQIDFITLLFTLGVLTVAVVIFGVVPALEVTRGDLHESLREGNKRTRGGARTNTLRRLLVRSEVSLALLLLIGAGLMVQSMIQLKRIDPGFARENVLTARIRLPEKTYPDVKQRQRFFDLVREKAAALPGVSSVATVLSRPLDNSTSWEMLLAREGQSWQEQLANPIVNFQAISPNYFQTLKIRVLKGREFTAHDRDDQPLVAIVSKGLAAKYWPNQDPIGKRVRRIFADQITPWITIVGVADDVRYRGWDKLMPDFYMPAEQNPLAQYIPYQDLIIRGSNDPMTLARPLREAVYSIDRNQAIASILTLDSLVDSALARPRFALLLMSVFGALALCLAVVGIYGLLSYMVTQRSWEIGLRLALGSPRQKILELVIFQGVKLVAGGLLLGLVAALVLTRFMSNMLYGVSALDLQTFVLVPLLLAGVALVATTVPALRAIRFDPVKVLRYD